MVTSTATGAGHSQGTPAPDTLIYAPRRPCVGDIRRTRPSNLCVTCQGDNPADSMFVEHYETTGLPSIGRVRVLPGAKRDTYGQHGRPSMMFIQTGTVHGPDSLFNEPDPFRSTDRRRRYGWKYWCDLCDAINVDGSTGVNEGTRLDAGGRMTSARTAHAADFVTRTRVTDTLHRQTRNTQKDSSTVNKSARLSLESQDCKGPTTGSHESSPVGSLRRSRNMIPARASILASDNSGTKVHRSPDFWRGVVSIQDAVSKTGNRSSADILADFVQEGLWPAGAKVYGGPDGCDIEGLCQVLAHEADIWGKPLQDSQLSDGS